MFRAHLRLLDPHPPHTLSPLHLSTCTPVVLTSSIPRHPTHPTPTPASCFSLSHSCARPACPPPRKSAGGASKVPFPLGSHSHHDNHRLVAEDPKCRTGRAHGRAGCHTCQTAYQCSQSHALTFVFCDMRMRLKAASATEPETLPLLDAAALTTVVEPPKR